MNKQEKKQFEERLWYFCQQNVVLAEPKQPLSEVTIKKWTELKRKLNIPELEEFLLQ